MDSRIVQKVVRQILLLEVISLMITVLLSYILLWPRLEKDAIQRATSTNAEIASQINTSVTNMADASRYIVTSNELKDSLNEYYKNPGQQYYHRVCLSINNLITSLTSVRGVVLEDTSGIRFNSVTNLRNEDFAILDSQLYEQTKNNDYLKNYSSIYTVQSRTNIYSMAYIRNYYIGSRNYTLTLFYNVNPLVSTVNNLSSATFNGSALTDFQGQIFYQTEAFAKADSAGQAPLVYSYKPYEKHSSGYYFYNTVESTGWNMVSFMNRRTLYASFTELFAMTLLLCMTLCILTIFFVIPAISRIIRPIHELSQIMETVAHGDLNSYSDIHTNDEIGDLSNVYNQMIDSLNQHIEALLDYEAKESKMKYNLLIAQIDSHFIYNTMSIINSFARSGKTKEIIAINTALTKILQNCLRVRAIDVTDTVSWEMDIVDQYWIIESMRYDNEALLLWDVPETLKNEHIPKNLLQPIVENCLFHGLMDADTGIIRGTITVTMNKTDTDFIICIADNGVGISEPTLTFLNQPGEFMEKLNERGKHIGLSNIRQRLDYIYHGRARMTIENRGGTAVTMMLPLN